MKSNLCLDKKYNITQLHLVCYTSTNKSNSFNRKTKMICVSLMIYQYIICFYSSDMERISNIKETENAQNFFSLLKIPGVLLMFISLAVLRFGAEANRTVIADFLVVQVCLTFSWLACLSCYSLVILSLWLQIHTLASLRSTKGKKRTNQVFIRQSIPIQGISKTLVLLMGRVMQICCVSLLSIISISISHRFSRPY